MRLLPKNAKEKYDKAVCCTATTTVNSWNAIEAGKTDVKSIYYLPKHLVVKRSSEWRCKNCDCLNPLDKYVCHNCGAPKR